MPGHGARPDVEAMFEKKLADLQEKTDLLVKDLSEAKSAAERDAVNEKIEQNRAEKMTVETQLREARNRRAAGATGAAGSDVGSAGAGSAGSGSGSAAAAGAGSAGAGSAGSAGSAAP
jgi:hypothetical protein